MEDACLCEQVEIWSFITNMDKDLFLILYSTAQKNTPFALFWFQTKFTFLLHLSASPLFHLSASLLYCFSASPLPHFSTSLLSFTTSPLLNFSTSPHLYFSALLLHFVTFSTCLDTLSNHTDDSYDNSWSVPGITQSDTFSARPEVVTLRYLHHQRKQNEQPNESHSTYITTLFVKFSDCIWGGTLRTEQRVSLLVHAYLGSSLTLDRVSLVVIRQSTWYIQLALRFDNRLGWRRLWKIQVTIQRMILS